MVKLGIELSSRSPLYSRLDRCTATTDPRSLPARVHLTVSGVVWVRHARDVVGVGGGAGMHVMFSLVTPKVRLTRVVLLLGFRPQVGATIL